MYLRKPTPGVTAVREAGFPGFDNALESKCRRPEYYGIQPVPAAAKALGAANPADKPIKRKYPENRKNPCRVQTRISKAANIRLQRAFALSSHKTMQEFVAAAVERYTREILKNDQGRN